MATLRNHFEMIDLNPLVIHRIRLEAPPPYASAEECNAKWYQITDTITYMPGIKSDVSYNSCFNDLTDGLQTHTFAPAGVEIKSRWLLGGSLPGEPSRPAELGLNVPKQGLYLQEEVDLKCNFMLTSFVKKNLVKAHAQLVDKMLEKGKAKEDRKSVPEKSPVGVSMGGAASGTSLGGSIPPVPANYQRYSQLSGQQYNQPGGQQYNQPGGQQYSQAGEQQYSHPGGQNYNQRTGGFEPYKPNPKPAQRSWIDQYAPGSSTQPAELPSEPAQRPPVELA